MPPKNIPLLVKNISDRYSLPQNHELRINEETTDKDFEEQEFIDLTSEQKEELIDKLETKKFNLKTLYKKTLLQNENTDSLTFQIKEVKDLLAKIKECDAITKIDTNIKNSNQVQEDFKKNNKRLAVSEFNKIIDLTAPKEERGADISTEQIWNRSKTVIFKNKTYRPPPEEKLERFKNKMKLKTMPKSYKADIQHRTEQNTAVINIRQNNKEMTNYRIYDPLNYSGLNSY